MERKSFEDRLNEIYWELCKNWTEIAKEAHVNIRMLLDIKNKKRGDRGINLRFVEKLGYGHGLIPIAFYKESDGQIENLGIEGFFYGEKIYNYVGRVFEKYRELNNLSTRELGERVDISHAFISLLERGVSKGTIQTIERIGKGLGLAPAYLLQRFPIAPLIIDGKLVDVDCVFKEVIASASNTALILLLRTCKIRREVATLFPSPGPIRTQSIFGKTLFKLVTGINAAVLGFRFLISL